MLLISGIEGYKAGYLLSPAGYKYEFSGQGCWDLVLGLSIQTKILICANFTTGTVILRKVPPARALIFRKWLGVCLKDEELFRISNVKSIFHLCVRVIKCRPGTFALFTLPVLKNHVKPKSKPQIPLSQQTQVHTIEVRGRQEMQVPPLHTSRIKGVRLSTFLALKFPLSCSLE